MRRPLARAAEGKNTPRLGRADELVHQPLEPGGQDEIEGFFLAGEQLERTAPGGGHDVLRFRASETRLHEDVAGDVDDEAQPPRALLFLQDLVGGSVGKTLT